MRPPRVPFTVPLVIAAVILVAIIGVVAAIERREKLRNEAAILTALTAYRDAKLTRELADAAVNEYNDVTFRRELASVEDEIKAAEDGLDSIENDTSGEFAWAERIRSKGYLLLISGVPSQELAVKKAAFAVEQAKSKKAVLERYTKVKTLKKLNDQIANAKENERAKKADYDGVRATPVGLNRRVIRSN